MNIPKLENLNCSNCTERSIKIHYPEFYEFIISNYEGLKWTEKLYWYYHDIKDHPICKVCGKPTKFINLSQGYREFCGYKCMNSSNEIKERRKLTNIDRFGVDNAMKSTEIVSKLKSNNILKYGVDNPSKSQVIKDKIRQSNLDKYGYEYTMKNPLKVSEMLDTRKRKTIANIEDLIDITEDGLYVMKCHNETCKEKCNHTYIIPPNILYDRKRLKCELCTKLMPIGCCIKNTSIEKFVKDILDKHDVTYITNSRDIIPPKEIDIYIPSKHIAIECNGIYFHKDKQPNYHYNKFKECQSKDIQLLTIWEDWICNKPDVVESIILSKLGIYDNRIYARDCSINLCDPRELLNKSHIQGSCGAGVKLGLYYKGELVSCMLFSKKKKSIQGCGGWELVRFCNKIHTQVVGGASKLFKYFIKNYHPEMIYSFSSNDISNGNIYKILGFDQGPINQSYWYIDSKTMKRYHRTSFTKDSIISRGWKDSKIGWTEYEIMNDHGYYRIYDSGQTKWTIALS